MSSSGYENNTSSRGSFSHNWPSKNFKGQTLETQRASQEHTKQQASVTVAQEPAPDKVNVPKFVADNLHICNPRGLLPQTLASFRWWLAIFLEFDDMPFQPAKPAPYNSFSKGEELIIAAEIINEATHCANKYISTFFTRPKKNESLDNLKNLNQCVKYQHIMESLQSAVQLIQKDYWIAVLYLKDAFPMHR